MGSNPPVPRCLTPVASAVHMQFGIFRQRPPTQPVAYRIEAAGLEPAHNDAMAPWRRHAEILRTGSSMADEPNEFLRYDGEQVAAVDGEIERR